MITTLPGLYVASVVILKPLSWMFNISMQKMCTTFALRSINIGFAVGNLILMFLILMNIHRLDKVCDYVYPLIKHPLKKERLLVSPQFPDRLCCRHHSVF